MPARDIRWSMAAVDDHSATARTGRSARGVIGFALSSTGQRAMLLTRAGSGSAVRPSTAGHRPHRPARRRRPDDGGRHDWEGDDVTVYRQALAGHSYRFD